MVQQRIIRVRRLISLQLVVLAFLTTTLVAVGSGSIFLPMLTLVIGVSSILFVDWFEWFSLHHFFAYIGMVGGTIVALIDYFYGTGSGSASGKLYCIASLLVYPEIVIMLQRKNMRLFEQMAIFLLLEIIVAALVNDNVLFGILLAPIVLLWVSSLLLLCRYTALIQLAPELDRPTPRLIEVLVESWRRSRLNHLRDSKKIIDVTQVDSQTNYSLAKMTLFSQSASIGIFGLGFAAIYFFMLPRTAMDSSGSFALVARTGFSESVILDKMTKLLQDTSPVLRLTLKNANTGLPYQVHQPPYVRGSVVGRFTRNSVLSGVNQTNPENPVERDIFKPLVNLPWDATTIKGDEVLAEFDILASDGSTLPCIAPMHTQDKQLSYISALPFEWRLINNRSDVVPSKNKPRYEITTYAFRNGEEVEVLPDSRAVFGRPDDRLFESLLNGLKVSEYDTSLQMSKSWKEDFLQKVRAHHPEANGPVAMARAIESYFSMSGEYSYTLDMRVSRQTDMDPIENFVVNVKRGHCQYFASALAAILRHLQIPTRLVVGYHPLEYNELGEYFTIRNSDAHAWVEAYFTAEQLAEAKLSLDESQSTGGWLRLDPTPAGPGSNAGDELRTQRDQTTDYAQRVWNDYILNRKNQRKMMPCMAPSRRALKSPIARW